MMTKDDLLQEFGEVHDAHGCCFAEYAVATYSIYCCLRLATDQTIAVVSRNINDPAFAADVALRAPAGLPHDRPTVFEIPPNAHGFTHAMAVPSTYHGFLNQIEKRAGLFLCVPIYRCEFSGDESADEFRQAAARLVPVYEWDRAMQPRINLYFDNPRTGGGTDDVGATVDRAVADAAKGHSSLHALDLELPTGRRSFDFSFRPLLDAEGAVTAVVSEAVETTARLQAEHALRQSQKIEAVGQLTGGIAHDFNNILTVISGNVEHAMLLSERAGEPGAMVGRALDNALKGVGRAASLTQRLLAFARRQPLHNQAANLNDRLLDMHDMLQRALGELVQLDIRVAEDIWCIEIDVSQLEASVLNLAVNARDAMPHGGRLAIEVDNSHLDHDYATLFPDAAPGEYVMLRVRDNGHGMDAATLARVFEPFFTTKQVGRGTGLGLSMVHGFVKQSGGHVLIDSVEGGGTSITMMFPRSALALPCEGTAPQTGLAGYSPREETILVAEDNDDVRAHTVDALRMLGYRVLEAHDGPSALRLLERPDTTVDLLFSDVVMPGMSGWELVREVRERWPDVAVLFTSGYPRDHDAVGSQGRAAALLPKPFTRSDLAQAVRTALEAALH